MFFYLKRRNLSLDNRKRITTIYVTVWKLFTYTRLEIVIKFSHNADLMDMRKFYILNGILEPILNLFFYLKRRNLSLDNRKRITTSCYLCLIVTNFPKCRFDGYAKILYFERNTWPILNLFFYLKRRNLSLDNRKRITTIYVTVWKLFTYTRLEIVINFPKCRFDGYAKILYFERNTQPILNFFFI